MRAKGGQPILVALATLLFLGHHVEGQASTTNTETTTTTITTATTSMALATTTKGMSAPITTTATTTSMAPTTATMGSSSTTLGVVTVNTASGSLYAVDRAQYCSAHTDNPAVATVSSSAACMYPLIDYACSSASLSSNTVAAALTCAITNTTMKSTQSDYIVLVSSRSVDEVRTILDSLNTQISGINITDQGKEYIVKAVWQNIYNQPLLLSEGFLASYFQLRLHRFLSAINDDILSCLTNFGLSCDGLKSMVIALDAVYMDMQNSTKSVVANWIQRTLTAQGGCGTTTMAQWTSNYWKEFGNYATYSMYTMSWSGFNAASDLQVLLPNQLATYVIVTRTLTTESGSVGLLLALSKSEATFILSFLDELYSQTQAMSAKPDYNRGVLHSLLVLTLFKVNENYPNICVTSMKMLFQQHLKPVLSTIDNQALAMIPSSIGCSDFQDIGVGLDSVYNDISSDQQQNVLDYKVQYLQNQTNKDGSPCLFSNMTSTTWMTKNVGTYSFSLNITVIFKLNPRFNAFDAADVLSPRQLAQVVPYSNILTDPTVADAEIKMFAILATLNKRSFAEFKSFIVELQYLTQQAKITTISAVNIRNKMQAAFWAILAGQFPSFNSTDYGNWLGWLSLFTSSITSDQLNQIPTVQDCTTFRTFSSGFSLSFDGMSKETQNTVGQYLINIANTTVNLTAECPGGNFLKDNFKKFSGALTVDQIRSLNSGFDFSGALTDMSASQLGGAVIYIENSLTDPTIMPKIFVPLTTGTQADVIVSLGQFWDSFNIAFNQTLAISADVQSYMLTSTLREISPTFNTMTDDEFKLWWTRFKEVVPATNAAALAEVPQSISCNKSASLVAALSPRYSDFPENNAKDAFNFMIGYLSQSGPVGVSCSQGISTTKWFTTYLAKFSARATYSQLATASPQFDGFEVLSMLTPAQISNMILQTDTLVNTTRATQFTDFLKTAPVDSVHTLMANFTTAANSQIEMGNEVNILLEVGVWISAQLILIFKSDNKMKSFQAADWRNLFESELYYFTCYIDASSLQLIVPSDCASVMTIASSLNEAYDKMSNSTRSAVVNWLVGTTIKPGGCQANYTQMQWVQLLWGNFTKDASLLQIQNSFTNFDVVAALAYLPINCKVDYIMSSDALVNATTMDTVLNSLKSADGQITLATVDEFMSKLNLQFKVDLNIIISFDTKERVMTRMMDAVSKSFTMFTPDMYEHYFKVQFSRFLSGIKADSISLLKTDMSCKSLSIVVSAFSSSNSDRSDDVKRKFAEFIKASLQYQKGLVGANGNVCSALYSSSSTFLSTLIMDFKGYFNLSDYQTYYTTFDTFSVIAQLSEDQLAELFVVNCLSDSLKASQVLLTVQGFTYAQAKKFMEAFIMQLAQNGISALPQRNVQDLLFSVIFNNVAQNIPSADYGVWFGTLLSPIISSMSTQNIASLPASQDCNGQADQVAGFGKSFDKLSPDQKEGVHARIKNFVSTQGAACAKGMDSSTFAFRLFGKFIITVTLDELTSSYPNFKMADVLDQLAPGQLAEYSATSKAFTNRESFLKISQYVTTTAEVAEFMTKANSIAPTQLQNNPIGGEILVFISNVISKDYSTFTQDDWHNWFNVLLINMLQYANQTFLDAIPTTIDCGSHKEIVNGFNSVYDAMSEDKRRMVYNSFKSFMSAQANPSGTVCGNATMSSQEWSQNNFGSYFIYAIFGDIFTWFKYFTASTIIDKLSEAQLADYTLQGTVLSDNDLMCPILARLHKKSPEVIYRYLDQFYTSAMMMNFSAFPNADIRNKMCWQFFGDIQTTFSQYKSGNWSMLFNSRMKLFAPSFDASSVTTILQSANCDVERQLVSFLNPVTYTADQQGAVTQALIDFLSNTTGGCLQPGEGDLAWLVGSYGQLAPNVPYNTIAAQNPKFNPFAVASSLSSMQLAGAVISGNNVNDPIKAQSVAQVLQGRSAKENQMFAQQFNAQATQNGILSVANIDSRDIFFYAVFNRTSDLFGDFSTQDWIDFMTNMNLLLPSINPTSMALFPNTISCPSYQVIIAGFDKCSMFMSSDSKAAVCKYASDYLAKRFKDTGNACSDSTPDSSQWISQNLLFCKNYVTYDQMNTWNPYFDPISAASVLTPSQLGQFAAAKCLQNPAAMGAIFKVLDATEVGLFLDSMNMAVTAKGLTKLPNAEVRKLILTDTMCRVGPTLSTATPDNFIDLFGSKLKFCLVDLDATSLGYIPKTISCDSLRGIVGVVGNSSVKSAHSQDIVAFFISVLLQQQTDTGTACLAAGTTDRDYLMTYFGSYSIYLDADSILSLKSDFTGVGCVDILSTAALAGLAVKTSAINSASSFSMVFDAKMMSQNLVAFQQFVSTARSLSLQNPSFLSSSKAKENLLLAFLSVLGPMLDNMPVSNVSTWFDSFDFVLDAINATMLDYIPLDISCSCYQIIVSRCNAKYSVYNTKQKAAVLDFCTKYLTQASEGSACTSGVINTADYVQRNLGNFCIGADPEKFKGLYENFSAVSFNAQCSK